MSIDYQEKLISKILYDLDLAKACDIKSYSCQQVVDCMIVASSESLKHTKALAQNVIEILKKDNINHHVEGYREANWILIDTKDFMVHIFQPQVRQYYQVDKLWG